MIGAMGPARPLRFERAWRAVGFALVAAVVVLSLVPAPELPLEIDGGDKIGHVLAYAALMVWFAQLHAGAPARAAIAAGFIAMGIGLEHAQGALGFRRYDVLDMVANTAGVLLGWLFAPPRGPRFLSWMEGRLRRVREEPA
jgi:VanZ family protein